MLNPGKGILGEFVGELGVGGVFAFDVELVVEFFEVSGDFTGLKGVRLFS